MAMRDDFCAFILTHGRPDRVHTYKTLMKAGYTGKVFIVIDDEDDTADEYRKRFGDKVLQFCKREVAERIDEGDNFNDRRAIIYARNVCWDLARQVGVRYFIQLDDDYVSFRIRFSADSQRIAVAMTHLDDVFDVLINLQQSSNHVLSVAMSQGADIGSVEKAPSLRRKCMNSFVCAVDRPFMFVGRINEDVNTYVLRGRQGAVFFTVIQAQLNQMQTQQNPSGMTDLYLDAGTYIKSFYPVMYAPSCVQIGVLRTAAYNQQGRIHHKINWHVTAPKILREEWKRAPDA